MDAVREVTIEDIKQSLRIDVTADDSLLQGYLDSAKQYIQDAVDPEADLTQYQQYNFAVSMLVQFWYISRDSDMKKTPYQVRSMIQQLRGKIA